MSDDRAAAASRGRQVVSEAAVRATLSRLDVFGIVRAASLEGSVQHGPVASAVLSGHDIGVKIGKVKGAGFGVKVRAGSEGRYLSIAWDNGCRLIGVVESSYLTYCRTAAALVLPVAELSSTLTRVLIMGSGRLGQACALLVRDLYPLAIIQLWSPSSRDLTSECAGVLDGWWTPDARRDDEFDLLLTCTRSPEPLPLDTVNCSYVGVGGAVDGRRRELSGNLLREVGAIYADDPDEAALRCRDLDGLAKRTRVRPLSDLAAPSRAPVGRTLTFVCGSGGYDALLAAHVLTSRVMPERPPEAAGDLV